MPKLQRLLMVASLTLLLPFLAQAENNNHTNNQNEETASIGAMPSRGMTMETVKHYFGEPNQRHSPIGKPAISRWQYDDMIIYFESEYVIHSVATDNNHK